MRLAIISLIRTPYFEPLYGRLSREPGLRVRVFHLQARDSLRAWTAGKPTYDAVQLPCWTPEWLYAMPVLGVMNPGAVSQVGEFAPNCLLIHGYSYWTQFSLVRWAVRREIPYLLWGDSSSLDRRAGGAVGAIKRRWLEYFCRHAAGILTIGTLNAQFWRRYGAPPERLFFAPFSIDNERFGQAADCWRARRQQERRRLGLPGRTVLLFAGRLAAEKNLASFLEALARHQRQGGQASLVVAGDGPQSGRLRRLCQRLGLTGVSWLGFQPQEELARLYGIADALVLPSLYEPWGLVVNEAMAAGLPVLVSRSVGCLPDLLAEGENGLSFDAQDRQSMVECLARFEALDEEARTRMGARSRQAIRGWGYETTLGGIRRALHAACPGRMPVSAEARV